MREHSLLWRKETTTCKKLTMNHSRRCLLCALHAHGDGRIVHGYSAHVYVCVCVCACALVQAFFEERKYNPLVESKGLSYAIEYQMEEQHRHWERLPCTWPKEERFKPGQARALKRTSRQLLNVMCCHALVSLYCRQQQQAPAINA
jgi:hypothetical protein